MKTTFASILLVVVVLLQSAWFVWPRQGSTPLSPQTKAAAEQMAMQRTTESQTRFEAEWQHDRERLGQRHVAVFVLWLAADVAVFFVWRLATRRVA